MKNLITTSALLLFWTQSYGVTVSKTLVKVGDCVEVPTNNPTYYKNEYRLKVHSLVRSISGLQEKKSTVKSPDKIELGGVKEKVQNYVFYPEKDKASALESCEKARALFQKAIDSQKTESHDCGGEVSSSDRSLNEKADTLGSKPIPVSKKQSSKQ